DRGGEFRALSFCCLKLTVGDGRPVAKQRPGARGVPGPVPAAVHRGRLRGHDDRERVLPRGQLVQPGGADLTQPPARRRQRARCTASVTEGSGSWADSTPTVNIGGALPAGASAPGSARAASSSAAPDTVAVSVATWSQAGESGKTPATGSRP